MLNRGGRRRRSRAEAGVFTNQAADQYDLYQESGDPGALAEALKLAGLALEATPFRDPMWASRLFNLSLILLKIYEATGKSGILGVAARQARAAVAATEADDPDRVKHLTTLVVILGYLAGENGDAEILREAVSFARAAISADPSASPRRARSFYSLATTLSDLFECTGEADAQREAIAAGRRAVEEAPAEGTDRIRYAEFLGRRLHDWSESTGDLGALQEAIELGRTAVAAAAPDDPEQARYADYLGKCLHSRFQRTGDTDALRDAITVRRAACAAMADDHPDRPRCLFNLAITLFSEFEESGDADSLLEALAADRAALAAIPPDDVSVARYAYDLSYNAYRLYDLTSAEDALSESVTAGRLAVESAAEGSRFLARDLYHLCLVLQLAFEQNGDLDTLRQAVAAGRAAIEATPDGEPVLALGQFNVSFALSMLGRAGDDPDALGEALLLWAAGVAATDPADPERATRVAALCGLMVVLLKSVRNSAVLRQAVAQASAALVSVQTDDGPAVQADMSRLDLPLIRVFDTDVTSGQLEVLGLLREGELIRQSIRTAYAGRDLGWAGCLAELTTSLGDSLSRTADADTAVVAIAIGQAAIAATSPEDSAARLDLIKEVAGIIECFRWVTESLRLRKTAEVIRAPSVSESETEGSRPADLAPGELDFAVEMLKASIKDDSPERSRSVLLLADSLMVRFSRSGVLHDLNSAIEILKDTIAADDPEIVQLLRMLSQALAIRYDYLRSRDDIDGSIQAASAALAVMDKDDPQRAGILNRRGLALIDRYRLVPALADITAAISSIGEAADTAAPGDLSRGEYFNNLGYALEIRYTRSESFADLDAAVQAYHAAVGAVPAGSPAWAFYQGNLGNTLVRRFDISRDFGKLHLGLMLRIADAMAAAGQTTGGSGSIMLDELNADLDHGIEAIQQALEAIPPDDAHRMSILSHLADALISRYHRDDDRSDLDQAISVLSAAQEILDQDKDAVHGSVANRRIGLLNDMAVALLTRFRRTGNADDREAGLSCYLKIAATPTAEPRDRIRSAKAAARWIEQDSPGDAADLLEQAVDLLPRLFLPELDRSDQTHVASGSRELATAAAALALADPRSTGEQRAARALRLLETGRTALLNQTLALRGDISQLRASHPELAGRLSHVRGQLSADPTVFEPGAAPVRPAGTTNRHELTGELAAAVAEVRDLPGFESFGRPLPPSAYQDEAGAGPVVALNVSPGLRNHFLIRGSTLQTMTELSADLDAAEVTTADLGDMVDQLSEISISGVTIGDGPVRAAESTMKTRDGSQAAAERFATMVKTLTAERRPGELVTGLNGQSSASTDAASRGDAILLTDASLTSLELPGLTADAVVEQVRNLYLAIEVRNAARFAPAEVVVSSVLEWLWDNIAGPVLDALGYTSEPSADAEWPRIWWAPGGILGLLPLHAAGYHMDPPGSRRTVMDRVISSYTPTIDALHRSRERSATAGLADRSLIVAMPANPDRSGVRTLPGAAVEAALLEQLLPGPRVLSSSAPSPDDRPTRDAVLAALPDHSIAHFACHAQSDPIDPSSSSLHLYDRDLTVADLESVDLNRAQLAYMSACSTAKASTGAPHGLDLIDSMLNIAGAIHLAGYPHVIATQWEVLDRVAAYVAGAFYAQLRTAPALIDVGKSAHALNAAVRAARDKYPDLPSFWASYLHIGI